MEEKLKISGDHDEDEHDKSEPGVTDLRVGEVIDFDKKKPSE